MQNQFKPSSAFVIFCLKPKDPNDEHETFTHMTVLFGQQML